MVDDVCIMPSGALERIICHEEYDKRLDDLDKTAHWGVVDFTDFYAIECCEIIRFTGLLDKNGKEIYEGDILLFADGSKSEVFFDEGSFTVEDAASISMTGYWFSEVIGNIHENPKLLIGG